MKLIDVVTAPWAIVPDKLLEIKAIYETHLRGEKIDIKAVEARIGRPLVNEQKAYEVIDGVAVIPVHGVIAKRANWFMQISGGISTELLARDVKAAINDPDVAAIILDIDSPGGTVDGTADLASVIHAARGTKPVVAYTDGTMCSAAYWIGSAADKLYIGNDTTQVGSIGVVASHTDVSRAEEMKGYKTTEVYAGKYKRIASQYASLSDEGRATIQERVDYLYSVFVAAVAEHRGVSVDKVLSDMADGKIFTGKQAMTAGLVDGVSTLDALISELSSGGVPDYRRANSNSQEEAMDIQKLKAEHPATYNAVRQEGVDAGKAEGAAAIAAAKEEGAKAERERIQGVYSLMKPGREKLLGELAFDGKTTKAEAAEKILAADDAKREAALKGLKEDAEQALAKPGDPGIGGNEDKGEGKDGFMALVEAHQKEKNCSHGEAISAMAKAHPEAHQKYIEGFQK